MKARVPLSYVLTIALTLGLAYALFGARPTPAASDAPRVDRAAQRPSSIPSPIRSLDPSPSAPAPPPTGPPLGLAAEVWEASQADEQINIRVYEVANRGVVNITTSATRRGFFEDSVSTGSGSGFVLDRRGHVLTNYHVVEGADAVQVGLFDGSVVDGVRVGVDPTNDLAVLRVDVPAAKLWPLPFGASTGLKVGQKVLALGNPFGLERTLTTGIISSLDRSIEASNGRMIKGIIQTDAAINPGNSGGPLLDARGQVIGMNTAIFSKVGQSAGIGFAVPIAHIQRVLDPLIRDGRVVRADLGLRLFGTEDGLLIVDVVEGGPADLARLRPIEVRTVRRGPFLEERIDPESADLIVAIDGVRVRTVDQLLSEVESHEPGRTISVTVVRRGRTLDVPVTLGRSS